MLTMAVIGLSLFLFFYDEADMSATLFLGFLIVILIKTLEF